MAFNIDIEKAVRNHMEQQPYECFCAECGGIVTLDIIIDDDMDMIIKVPVCECVKREEND